jgi:serine/threonine protein kinase
LFFFHSGSGHSSDQMYALGATLIEILTGAFPFPDLTNEQVVASVLLKSISLTDSLPKDLPPVWGPFLAVARDLMQHEATLRPTATQAIARLLEHYQENGQPIVVRNFARNIRQL